MRGQLIVLEGADGAGKSTLAELLCNELRARKLKVSQEWFPGRKDGTLGKLIYRLHHDKNSLEVNEVTPTALQALHIAAHLDLIERDIKPFVLNGGVVVLDRFWWSTLVYGNVSGIDEDVLNHLVSAEKSLWGKLLPRAVFLIDRKTSLKQENLEVWENIRQFYLKVFYKEKNEYPCHLVSNEKEIDDAMDNILNVVDDLK